MPPPKAQLPSPSDPALLAMLGGGAPPGGPMPQGPPPGAGAMPPGGGGAVALLAQIQMLLDQAIQMISAEEAEPEAMPVAGGLPPGV